MRGVLSKILPEAQDF